MIRVGIAGGTGRLGKEMAGLLLQQEDMGVGAVIGRRGSPLAGADLGELLGMGPLGRTVAGTIEETLDQCDVYIDVTNAQGFRQNAPAYREARKPLIIGTTGFDAEGLEQIKELSRHMPVAVCPNFSIGVYKFLKLVRYAASLLDAGMDVDVIEAHHKMKKDSPSGTAKKLMEAVKEERRKLGVDDPVVHAHSIRAGSIVGDHSVIFTGLDNERIELTHRVQSRDGFAQGVLHSVRWIAGKDHGLYGLDDLFGDL